MSDENVMSDNMLVDEAKESGWATLESQTAALYDQSQALKVRAEGVRVLLRGDIPIEGHGDDKCREVCSNDGILNMHKRHLDNIRVNIMSAFVDLEEILK